MRKTVPEAFAAAKQYTHAAIVAAPGLGHGHGPLNHLVSPVDSEPQGASRGLFSATRG